MSRRAAFRVARRAHKQLRIPRAIAFYIAFAARKYRVRWALAYALFEQESIYQVIFGHDAGGLYPGRPVTKANYRLFRNYVVGHRGAGANGVGLGQVTYWTYVRDHAGLWKPRVQVYLSLSILAGLVDSYGERTGCGAYNGGAGNPNESYADEVLERAARIRPKLAKERP